MLFFKILFYALGIITLYYELLCFQNAEGVLLWRKQAKSKLRPDPKLMSNAQLLFIVIGPIYFLWSVIGLFTINWACFVVIFILAFLPKSHKIIIKLDAVICMALIIFTVINTFHIGIDPGKYFFNGFFN